MSLNDASQTRFEEGHSASSDRFTRGRLRLRTLVLIRWIAVVGQTVTVLLVHFGLGFSLPLTACLAVIAASVLSNILLYVRMPMHARLGDRDSTLLLGFDILQLSVLLYLTGGLENPFAILIVAPVTVSATILSRGPTIVLMMLAVTSITGLALYHAPLPWGPDEFQLPGAYALGVWTALAVASVFIATYVWSVADEARRMSDALAETRLRLGREQSLTALGGLAAAAAHELGSPLATIAVVAKELSRDIPPDSEIAEDVALLMSQSDRCRDILAGLDQRHIAGHQAFARAPLSILLERAGKPYHSDGVVQVVVIETEDEDDYVHTEPTADDTPELAYGLGNLIQNAVQFARSRVELRLHWNDETVRVTVSDDGPGFSSAVFASLGEPYMSTRGGEHMGLGFFIAQTLLERGGATLEFRNRNGAEVVIRWSRERFDAAMEHRTIGDMPMDR
ncbi:MAG: ActS/PrrB/RegB family redox-sensitive histidine kinase [Alphaproteobacteria bacterium]|jgi:two-component system sensor histidine kinase RegB